MKLIYISDDGTHFDTQSDCLLYEENAYAINSARDWWVDNGHGNVLPPAVGSVVAHIMETFVTTNKKTGKTHKKRTQTSVKVIDYVKAHPTLPMRELCQGTGMSATPINNILEGATYMDIDGIVRFDGRRRSEV